MEIKTFNHINKDIREIIIRFLEYFNLTSFEVLQLNQPTKNKTNNSLLYQILNINNYGWQSVKYKEEDNKLYKTNEYKEKIQVKISCLKKRELTDTKDTIESKDIISLLKSFLLSDDGLKYLLEKGISIEIPNQIDMNDFVNENENYEFLPSLTINLYLKQSWNNQVDYIEEIKNKDFIYF